MVEGKCSSSCAASLKCRVISGSGTFLETAGAEPRAKSRFQIEAIRRASGKSEDQPCFHSSADSAPCYTWSRHHVARAELWIRKRDHRVTAIHQAGHQTALVVEHTVQRHRSKCRSDQLVDEIRRSAAEI